MVQLCLRLRHCQRQERRQAAGVCRPGDGPAAKGREGRLDDAAHMAKDTDLDAIRGREDFKKLIEGLAKQSPAEPEQKP